LKFIIVTRIWRSEKSFLFRRIPYRSLPVHFFRCYSAREQTYMRHVLFFWMFL